MPLSSQKSIGKAGKEEELESGSRCWKSLRLLKSEATMLETHSLCLWKISSSSLEGVREAPLYPPAKDIHCFGVWTAQHPSIYNSSREHSVWHRAGQRKLSLVSFAGETLVSLSTMHTLTTQILFSALKVPELPGTNRWAVRPPTQNEKDNVSSLHPPSVSP